MARPRESARLVPVAADAGGQFRIDGAINFSTVPDLVEQGMPAFAEFPAVEVDLAGVTHADSAGLALLLLWLERARHAGKTIVYRNIPAQLMGIARLSEVDGILSAAESPPALPPVKAEAEAGASPGSA